ncbi:hypothetical protein [Massilia frigida]|uniref:hypothetical protein n=1 Tax=Massilia frigida TaxID=2609281 RepID=UPI0016526FA7|nr:hypothetical protein [Massilia frigida]
MRTDFACPRCGSSAHATPKLLLIAKHAPVYGVDFGEGGHWPYQLASDECLPQALREPPLSQFVDGCYCSSCGIGFVPASLLVGAAPENSPQGGTTPRHAEGPHAGDQVGYLRNPGARPEFGTLAAHLWGADSDIDSDGNSAYPGDAGWTELTLVLRAAPERQRVDVDPVSHDPLVLAIRSPDASLATRALAYLQEHAGGTIERCWPLE